MNMEIKKPSRVYQLRDLFQKGTPRPAEELDNIDFSRPRSCTSPEKCNAPVVLSKPDNVKTKEPESVLPTNNSPSPTNIPSLTYQGSATDSSSSAWVVRKHRTISESEIDSIKDSNFHKEIELVTPKTPQQIPSRKPHEFNVSILYPIVPFFGNQNSKIRPLGEELQARRISKNLQNSGEESTNNDNRSQKLDVSSDFSEEINPPSLSNLPSTMDYDTTSTCKEAQVQVVDSDSRVAVKDNNRQPDNDGDLLFDETEQNGIDSDSDIDRENIYDLSNVNHDPLSAENLDDLLDAYSLELTRISADMAVINNPGSSSPESLHRAIVFQPSIMTPPETLIQNGIDYSEFQDFFLESENFLIQKPLNAESVDLEDRTTTSEEENDEEDGQVDDEDVYAVASRMDESEDQGITPTNDAISYEMICPKPMDVVSVENGCHILEDGNFFYEKIMEVVTEIEADFECQSIIKPNNDVLKTYKRPGAKVHFNLEKVMVYSTHVAGEYDRKNDDVDPLSASAEYEMEKRLENMNIFPVDLYKGSKGLGISILGMGVGHSSGIQKLGIFVKSIIKGGAAEEDGRIQVYDQIVEVNGESLVSVSQDVAASVLRNTHGVVHFLIGREIDQTNSEIVRLVEKSRQNSGIVSQPEIISSAPLAEMDDETGKQTIDLKSDEKEQPHPQDTTTFSLNPDSQTEDDDNLESEPFGTATSIIDAKCITTSTESTQTLVTWEQIKAKENLLNDVINDLNGQLDQSRLNEDKMYKTIFDLKDKIDDNHILKSEMELLSRNYDEIQSEFNKSQTELQEAQQLIEELSGENHLLKSSLEETTRKYKKVKRIFKMAELRNESQQNFDYKQSEILTFYEEKVKHLEKQVEELQLKLTSSDLRGDMDFTTRNFEPVLISSPSDEIISSYVNYGAKGKEIVQPKSSSVSSSDTDDERYTNGKNIEITSRVPQRRVSDKVLTDLNLNMSNNNTGINDDVFEELTNTNNMLDNRVAKNKAELRKTGLMANRKPPSKAIISGHQHAHDSMKCPDQVSHIQEIDNIVDEDNHQDKLQAKGSMPKVIGGYALPGKSEIKLAPDDSRVKSKHMPRIFGIKPSNFAGSKKVGKITQNSADDNSHMEHVSNSAKSWDPTAKTSPNHKESVILLSAKSLSNDAMFDKPSMTFYNSSLLPNDSAKGDSYILKEAESQMEYNELHKIPPSEWDKDQVTKWFRMIGLGHVETVLLNGGVVNGYKLIRLDSELIKKIGVSNSNDRMILKRKIKELRNMVPLPTKKSSDSTDPKHNINYKSKL